MNCDYQEKRRKGEEKGCKLYAERNTSVGRQGREIELGFHKHINQSGCIQAVVWAIKKPPW